MGFIFKKPIPQKYLPTEFLKKADHENFILTNINDSTVLLSHIQYSVNNKHCYSL